MSDKYTCAVCGGEFEKGWSDEEAEKEMIRDFGPISKHDLVVVCDVCYQKVCPKNNPKLHKIFLSNN